MEEYASVRGCIGIELYNNVCELINGNGESISYFERCLWEGKKNLCFATDDAHGETHSLGGFILVKAKKLTHKDIMDSIKAGSFYASNGGPEISEFYVEDGIVHISCMPSSQIIFYSNDLLNGKNDAKNKLLTQASWDTAKAWQPENLNYVFAACMDEKGRKSWTQPIWLD